MSDIGAVFEPHFLPDGKGLLVFWRASENPEDSRSGAYRISDGRAYKIISDSFMGNLTYDPSGYLLYAGTLTNLWALPYEPGNEPVVESPLLLLRNATFPSVSNDGSLIYKVTHQFPNQFGWVDKQGNELGRVGTSRKSNRWPVLAPDGSYFVFIGEPNANDGVTPSNESDQIFIHQLTAETERVLGELNGWLDDPAISYDGHRIAFQYKFDIWLMDVTGSSLEILERSPDFLFAPSWTPDGKVLYTKFVDDQTDIWLRDAHPDSTARSLIATPRIESIPKLSPDSRYLAYVTGREITDLEIYVQDYRDLNVPARRLGFGFGHRWSRDGKSLYFATADSLFKWDAPDDLAGLINRPVALFGFDHLDLTDDRGFDISPSGDRFLMTFKTGEPTVKTMLVQNWKHLLDE